MSVTVTDPISAGYVPNGATTAFPFDFKIASTSEIAVYQVLNDVASEVDPADYSVTLAGDGEGGTVTFDTAPMTGSGTIYILSDPLFTQTTTLSGDGPFTPTILNGISDRSAIRDLILNFHLNRAIKAPINEDGPAYPSATSRAGKYLTHDNAGNVVPGVSTATVNDMLSDIASNTATGADLEARMGAAEAFEGRTIHAKPGQTFPEIDKSNFIGQYFAGDAVGNPVPSAGTVTGGDATLRTDLANPAAGGNIVGFKNSGAGAATRTVSDRLEDSAAVKDFGALGDNSTNDAPAVDTAYSVSTIRRLDFPPATYVLKPTDVSPYLFGNTTAPVYRGVALDRSNVMLFGLGSTIHVKSRDGGVAGGDVQPIFSTDKNMTLGTITDLAFVGFRFDPGNDADAVNTNQRFIAAVGVSGLRYIANVAQSSESRRGYFSHIQNSENILIADHYHKKVTGGVNCRYCTNMVISAVLADDFSELFDFDSTCFNVAGGHIAARALLRVEQVLDINSGQQITLGNIAATGVGNIVTINYKTTTPVDYATYVGSPSYVGPPFVPARDIIIGDVVGTNVGTTVVNPVYIGWDWSAGAHVGEDPVRAITLRGSRLSHVGGSFICREAKNLVVSDHHWSDVTTAAGFAALHFISNNANADQLAWSDLEIDLLDSSVDTCNFGAVFISTPTRAHIRNLRVLNNNTAVTGVAALTITAINSRGGRAVVDGCDIGGDILINGDSTGIVAWAISTAYRRNAIVYTTTAGGAKRYFKATVDNGVSASSGTGPASDTGSAIVDGTQVWRALGYEPYSILWGKTNRINGAVNWQGDAHKFTRGDVHGVSFGDVAATGTVRRTAFIVRHRCQLLNYYWSSSGAVTASGANYRTVTLKGIRDGAAVSVHQGNTIAGSAAEASVDSGMTAGEATGAIFNPGDKIYVELASLGSGAALQDFNVTIEVIRI